jgi:peptidoglycan/xylan/chitin deacetylase (PgdA/CDA1 family)
MRRFIKRSFLHLARTLGLFRMAERRTAGLLRILCYHGLSLADEHEFRPMLHMRPETFHARLATIRHRGYPVLPLQQAIVALREGTLPPCAVVITFDDGFYDNLRHAIGPLREAGFPATIYVTTYHVVKRTPVFRLIVLYMFWKSTRASAKLDGVPGALTRETLRIDGGEDMQKVMWSIIEHGEQHATEDERVRIAELLGERLGVDYGRLAAQRCFSLMTLEELQRIAADGVDIQLHTHRHRMPDNRAALLREIADNRAALVPITGNALRHFCYPSGVWSRDHWPWLREAGIESGATCDPGLNGPDAELLGLKRFLDGESVSEIEFDAEISGFTELLRRRWKGGTSPKPAQPV